jgi:hypothetical protein
MKYNQQNIGGRIHYEYNGKYTGELGFSYSGSDNFAEGNRFGFYPAVSVGWIVSNEQFLSSSTAIDFLKLRLSVGKSAYDPFNWAWYRRYIYQQNYVGLVSYPLGNENPAWQQGLGLEYFANPDIFAEESMKYNLGIDAALFGGLNLTVDAFVDKRSGIVSPSNTMLATTGIAPVMQNLGKVTTSGVEIDLNYRGNAGKLRYELGGNITRVADRIDFMAELRPASPLAARTGHPIDAPNGYECIGFYDVADFNPDGSLKAGIPVPSFGNVQPGDLKYSDINEGGDGVIDEKDMLKIGKRSYPDLFFAIRAEAAFAGFDFRVLFQGAAGREVDILNSAYNKTVAFENNGNAYQLAAGRWAYYPEQGIDTRATATYPRLSALMNDNNYRNSTFWMKNGNFLRLRNIEIGYTPPSNCCKRYI